MNALNESLADLIRELSNISPAYANNFEEIGIRGVVTLEAEYATKGDPGYKAHLIRSMACEMALGILHKHGHGEEIVKHPWDREYDIITHRKDYAPAWVNNKDIPIKELVVRAWALKRKPTSWYDRETTKEFMEKLK